MADLKASYFDTLNMRNELMSRLATYLAIPKRLDDLDRMNNAMLASQNTGVAANASTLKSRIASTRATVETKITEVRLLTDNILILKDTVEKNPELQTLITGEAGLFTFAINSLLNKTAKNYTGLIQQLLNYSKDTVNQIKDMETITKNVDTLERDVKATYQSAVNGGAVPPLSELLSTGGINLSDVPTAVWWVGGALATVAILPLAYNMLRGKRK